MSSRRPTPRAPAAWLGVSPPLRAAARLARSAAAARGGRSSTTPRGGSPLVPSSFFPATPPLSSSSCFAAPATTGSSRPRAGGRQEPRGDASGVPFALTMRWAGAWEAPPIMKGGRPPIPSVCCVAVACPALDVRPRAWRERPHATKLRRMAPHEGATSAGTPSTASAHDGAKGAAGTAFCVSDVPGGAFVAFPRPPPISPPACLVADRRVDESPRLEAPQGPPPVRPHG